MSEKSKIRNQKNGGVLCHIKPFVDLCMIGQYWRSALTALRANKVRTFLTTLGIIIGIVTVVMVFALGESTNSMIEGEIEAYGSNIIEGEVSVPGLSHTSPANAVAYVEGVTITTLTEEDVSAIKDIPGVNYGYGAVFGLERVVSIYEDQEYLIQAVSSDFIEIDQSEVEYGRFYTESEDHSMARVVVLGYSVAQELFPDVDPIGQNVRIKGVNLEVIGVMEEIGMVFFQDMDEQVYVPLNTMQKLILGIEHILYFIVTVEDEGQIDAIKADIEALLDQRHNISEPIRRDFFVTTMQEAMDIMSTVTGALQILLVVLAAISLIVGGVGVMNIMFVAVSERTREIGLRKAVGASERAIMMQFLWEAVIITVAGGIIGVIIAVSLVWLSVQAAAYGGVEMGFNIPIAGVLLAVGAAIVEGLVFGLYPAKRAAKLNPIDSLRYE